MRIRLTIAYDGGPFRGWQSQAGGGAVQDHVEGAFKKICGERVAVHGAGRTDAGVHAVGQVAHADVTRMLDWVAALNANLPREIRVMRCVRSRADFHARFQARGKVYLYRIWNAAVLPPLELNRAWHVPTPLDAEAMRAAAKGLVGRRDFKGFAANRGMRTDDTVRTISAIRIRRQGPLITLRFGGEGFLYKMVRLMTGALMRIGQGRADAGSIGRYLDGTSSKCSFAAPAEGLCLVRVIY